MIAVRVWIANHTSVHFAGLRPRRLGSKFAIRTECFVDIAGVRCGSNTSDLRLERKWLVANGERLVKVTGRVGGRSENGTLKRENGKEEPREVRRLIEGAVLCLQ
jgi:hypothetical protein